MNGDSWDFGHIKTIGELKDALNSLPEESFEEHPNKYPIIYSCPIGKTYGIYLTFRNGFLVINKSDEEV